MRKHMSDIEHNAEALILRAAKEAGLTEEVAVALWFAAKHGLADECPDGPDNVAAAVLRALIDDFDESVCTPGSVVEHMFGEGLCIDPRSEADKAEVAAYHDGGKS
jgi:hypothetical protein